MHQKWCPFPPFVGLATNIILGDKVKFDYISDFAQNLLQSELDYGDSDPVVRFSI